MVTAPAPAAHDPSPRPIPPPPPQPVLALHLVDVPGYGPASAYVDWFWTPVLGSTSVLLWRRLATLAANGEQELDLVELAALLGVKGTVARHSVARLGHWSAVWQWPGGLSVAANLGRVPASRVARMPARLRAMHARVAP